MAEPIITAKTTAPTIRAIPISKPSILAVRIIANMFMAGPEYKKAIAGPKPAPRLWILENEKLIFNIGGSPLLTISSTGIGFNGGWELRSDSNHWSLYNEDGGYTGFGVGDIPSSSSISNPASSRQYLIAFTGNTEVCLFLVNRSSCAAAITFPPTVNDAAES